ncbi:MAG: hypothetical protein GY820_14245, partial [Gammaproteobacteria bacterium]|nr:hypothetical protein [Gammaproteobacteria bacterium]
FGPVKVLVSISRLISRYRYHSKSIEISNGTWVSKFRNRNEWWQLKTGYVLETGYPVFLKLGTRFSYLPTLFLAKPGTFALLIPGFGLSYLPSIFQNTGYSQLTYPVLPGF